MRSLLLIFVLAAMLATPAAAYEHAYIGLFADDSRTSWCIETTDPPFAFDVWVFCLPSDNGVRAAEFSISELAPTVLLVNTDLGPEVSLTLGDPVNGISYSMYLCQNDWFLLGIYHFLALEDVKTAIWLQPYDVTGSISVANCLPGYPKEDAFAYTSIFVNFPLNSPECAGTATEETSWGAIKDMYKR